MSGSSSAVLMTAIDQGGSPRLMHALRRHYLCVLSLISVCMIIALAAPPEELRKRQRLLSELLLTLDKYVQSLRELKEVRKTYSERSAEIKPGVEPSPKQFAGVVQLQSTVETEQALVAAETRPPGKSRKRTLR